MPLRMQKDYFSSKINGMIFGCAVCGCSPIYWGKTLLICGVKTKLHCCNTAAVILLFRAQWQRLPAVCVGSLANTATHLR